MSNEENINYEEEINNINKKINEIINNILDGHSFKWLTTKEYSDLDEESNNKQQSIPDGQVKIIQILNIILLI